MKKFLVVILCLVCVLSLCACTKKDKGDTVFTSEYIDLEVVKDSGGKGRVLVDRDTGVLYLWYFDNERHGQTLTPIYNADGTLKNIADFE